MEADYSKRELDSHFLEIKDLLKAGEKRRDDRFTEQDGALAEINARVALTNGRVKALEMWRMFLLGGMSIISMMVIPLITYIFLH